ncbi:MAG: Arginine--tRNA ligase [Pseudomonadota bacterium]|jgi:arginyl-tRNA synthetase
MTQTPKEALAAALHDSLVALAGGLHQDTAAAPSGLALPSLREIVQTLGPPKQSAHGDLATGLLMRLAKPWGLPPIALALALVDLLRAGPSMALLIDRVETAPPGFINVWLRPEAQASILPGILADPAAYGRKPPQANQTLLLEFVSANPTGPLHVGHGRQAALGDCLATILESQGSVVTREFYYNDAGAQIENLARSVQARIHGIDPDNPAFPADGYRGQYIVDIAQAYVHRQSVTPADGSALTGKGDPHDLEAIRQFAVAYLRSEQDQDLKAFGVRFDHFSLESALYRDGHVARVVNRLRASGHAYEAEGALWLRSTAFGDDKDRVMQKQGGGYTYFVPDVAYHEQKFLRGYQRAINIQGSDHHGTIARVRAGLAALDAGIPKDFPGYVLHKMVTVVRGGQEVKISKRAGSYVTLRDLIDWSGDGDTQKGRDAVRFFLVSRKADTEFVFDIDLALSRSDENPVYYVQYAHARACSLLGQAQQSLADWTARSIAEGSLPIGSRPLLAALKSLEQPQEKALCMRLSEFPEVLTQAADELAPHLLAFYLRDLAADLHSFYNAHRVLVDDGLVRDARLCLVAATAAVLRQGLGLLGVSAPERM